MFALKFNSTKLYLLWCSSLYYQVAIIVIIKTNDQLISKLRTLIKQYYALKTNGRIIPWKIIRLIAALKSCLIDTLVSFSMIYDVYMECFVLYSLLTKSFKRNACHYSTLYASYFASMI